jgi:soluble lytic murein transglycosylase-like protein
MNIASDLAAVEQRLTQITGSTIELPGLPEAPDQSASFADLVRAELAAQNTQAADGSEVPGIASGAAVGAINAPAMVPPAEIDRLVNSNASQWSVDPALVKAIIANESGFNANATSNAGAQGLMQLMPATAGDLGVTNAYDPAQNVGGGTRYIKGLLDRFNGDVRKAVAAYNAGPGAVEKYDGVPPYAETQNYVQNVLASYEKYRNQYSP